MTPNSPSQSLREIAKTVGGSDHSKYASLLQQLLDENGVSAQSLLVETKAGSAFVLETGSGEEPVVFVHGTPATSAVWVPLLGHLRGVHAYLVDRPSSGLSDDFEYGDVDPTQVRAHAVSFFESLLDSLGLESATLASSSYGGLWSMWFALDRPDRVRRLILAGAPPGMLSPRLPLIFGLLSVPWLAAIMTRLDPPSTASTKRFFRMMGDPTADLSDNFIATFTQSQRLPGAASLLRGIQQVASFPGRMHRSLWLDAEALRQIRVPTKFLWGPRDFLGGPDFGRKVVNTMPNAELEIIGTGHLPWLQDPDRVAAAIEEFTLSA